MKYFPEISSAKLAVGLLFSAAMLLEGTQTPKTRVGAATAFSERPTGAVAAPPTPQDYYNPWDSWLKSKGSPISGTDVWTASQEYRIRGEMLICITYAETNLGKVAQRGSHTNVGSVGSYDATNTTIGAESVLHGLRLIGQTLDNQSLGHKTTIAQLSRKSEPYGAIYAASAFNWENNVLTCLQSITGQAVSNQWQFRI